MIEYRHQTKQKEVRAEPMSRFVPEANQLAAEIVIAKRRLADLTRFGMGLSDRF